MIRRELSPAETSYAERADRAIRDSHDVADEVLDAYERDVVIQTIVDNNAAQPIQIDESSFHIVPEENPPIADAPAPAEPRELELRLTVNATGAVHALTHPAIHVATTGHASRVSVVVQPERGANLAPSDFERLRDMTLNALRERASEANETIAAERRKLEERVERVVGARWDRRRALVEATTAAGIPLAPVEGSTISIPLAPKLLTFDSATEAAQRGVSETSLSESIADQLVGMISAFARALERMPVTAGKLVGEDEESIRDILLFLFNANWHGAATGESFVGKGKTDILLRWRDRDAFIGECKIWKGEARFADGLTQLLERYTVWRATRVAMVLFIRDLQDITAAIDKARAVITSHDRFIRSVPGTDPEAFQMHAQHDRQRQITLNLVPVVLPQ